MRLISFNRFQPIFAAYSTQIVPKSKYKYLYIWHSTFVRGQTMPTNSRSKPHKVRQLMPYHFKGSELSDVLRGALLVCGLAWSDRERVTRRTGRTTPNDRTRAADLSPAPAFAFSRSLRLSTGFHRLGVYFHVQALQSAVESATALLQRKRNALQALWGVCGLFGVVLGRVQIVFELFAVVSLSVVGLSDCIKHKIL